MKKGDEIAEEMLQRTGVKRTRENIAMARSLAEGIKYSRGMKSKVKVEKFVLPVSPSEVKAFRKKLKLSQTQCAKVLAVKPETVKKWEQGGNPVSGPAAQWIRAAQKQPDMVEKLFEELVPLKDRNMPFVNY